MKDESLPQQVLWDLESYGWISAGDTVCCALSGGADSVCLLRCLLELRQTLGIQVSAVHVNHQIRGAESDGDEQFCRELCRALGVTPVMCRSWRRNGSSRWSLPPVTAAIRRLNRSWNVRLGSQRHTLPPTIWKLCCTGWCVGAVCMG